MPIEPRNSTDDVDSSKGAKGGASDAELLAWARKRGVISFFFFFFMAVAIAAAWFFTR